jgi:N-acyl-D-amino-acid deacylase
MQLTEELTAFGAVYTTHLRSEFEPVLEAMDEAFRSAVTRKSPVIISHLKCAGAGNWGAVRSCWHRWSSGENPACGLRLLSLRGELFDPGSQASHRCPSHHHHLVDAAPEVGGRDLIDIAAEWNVPLLDAAKRLQPAGAVYYGMDEADVRKILAHPLSMVGSDGLPEDPFPHPRLWGAFHECSDISVVMSGCFRCTPPCTR